MILKCGDCCPAKGVSSGRALQEAHGIDGHIEGLRGAECRPRSHSKRMPVQATGVMSCLPELKLMIAQPLSHSLCSHTTTSTPPWFFLLSHLPHPQQMQAKQLLLASEDGFPDFGLFPHGNSLAQAQNGHRPVGKRVGGQAVTMERGSLGRRGP